MDNTTLDGRSVVRAVLDNPTFHERTIVYADPKTDLPIEAWSQHFDNGVWATHQQMFMDYAPNYPAPACLRFQTDVKYPVLTQEQVDAKFGELDVEAGRCDRACSTKLVGHF